MFQIVSARVPFPITCLAIRLLAAHQDAMFATVPRWYIQFGQKPTKDNVVLFGGLHQAPKNGGVSTPFTS